jgi:hypothetical protein
MSFEIPGRPVRAGVLLIIAFVAMGACSHEQAVRSPAPRTLIDDPSAFGSLDVQRRKAAAESERRAAQEAQVKFEQEREVLRRRNDEERMRLELEQAQKAPDPYTMPFIPPDAPAAGAAHQ